MMKLVSSTYQGSKNGASLAVIDNKGETAFEIFDNLIGRIGTPVTKRPVGFDHKHGLVGALG